jgi:hypothetical protein
MKVIALMQLYNEAELAEICLSNRYNHMDKIIITEGLLTPFGNMPMRSPDGTRERVAKWIETYDIAHKCRLLDPLSEVPGTTRETREGFNKNYMLKHANVEDNDILHIMDADEFYNHNGIEWIIYQFRNNNAIRQCWPEEWQFCYNLRLAFKSRHGSRFLRYCTGAHFGKTNHFYHDRYDLVKDKSFIVPRKISGVCHLAFAKHPELIREKVISFNRPSLTAWFNNIYLRWPNETNLCRQGFAEGQSEPLVPYYGSYPPELSQLINTTDYFNEVKDNWKQYLI